MPVNPSKLRREVQAAGLAGPGPTGAVRIITVKPSAKTLDQLRSQRSTVHNAPDGTPVAVLWESAESELKHAPTFQAILDKHKADPEPQDCACHIVLPLEVMVAVLKVAAEYVRNDIREGPDDWARKTVVAWDEAITKYIKAEVP